MKMQIRKFNTVETATAWVDSSPLALVALYGNDDLIWVVSGRDVRELETRGARRV